MKHSFGAGILLGAAMTMTAFAVSSQVSPSLDPVKLSPQYYTVLLENERVRVLEYRLGPGESEGMHSHPAGIVYSFGEGRLRVHLPDAQPTEVSAKAGEVHWRDPITHALDNIGDTEFHALAVELKKASD
jgi:quercetin dioxygenase-like cupin family protein